MSNFCGHVWYGNSMALNEPSYQHYNHFIEDVKPGDIIEVYCRTHSVWGVCDKVDSEGLHWCYYLSIEESGRPKSVDDVGTVEPDNFYKHCRELVRNCAPCAREKARQEQVWSRLARPSLKHKCCQKDNDEATNMHSKVAYVKRVTLVDLLKVERDTPDILFNDGLYFARIHNQEILAEKFGLAPRNADEMLQELSCSWLDKQVPYNSITLNGEHYVTAWKYGSSWCNDGSDSWDSVGLDTGSAAIVRVLNGVGAAFENLATFVGTKSNGENRSVPSSEGREGTTSFSPDVFYAIQQKLKFV